MGNGAVSVGVQTGDTRILAVNGGSERKDLCAMNCE
jgi:hypothetical protein